MGECWLCEYKAGTLLEMGGLVFVKKFCPGTDEQKKAAKSGSKLTSGENTLFPDPFFKLSDPLSGLPSRGQYLIIAL